MLWPGLLPRGDDGAVGPSPVVDTNRLLTRRGNPYCRFLLKYSDCAISPIAIHPRSPLLLNPQRLNRDPWRRQTA